MSGFKRLPTRPGTQDGVMQVRSTLLILLMSLSACGEVHRTEMVVQHCESESDCPSGRTCDPVAGECVECWNDSQCAQGRCKPETGTCEECIENADCGDGVCALSMNRCVACMKQSDCKGGKVCSRSTYECVECEEDLDCVASGPCHVAGCFQNRCEEMALPDASMCEDNDPCTAGERCYAGVCQWTQREPSCEPDNDFDGVTVSEGDCRDDDAEVYPGASERCDGKDNDCDGIVDPASCQVGLGCRRTGCLGQICSDAEMESDCTPQPEYACMGLTSCGPFGPGGQCEFQPTPAYLACYKDLCTQSAELCDGKDNDCDGKVDEGEVCGKVSCQTACDCYDQLGNGFAKACALACFNCGNFWQCVDGACLEVCGVMPELECGPCGTEVCGNDLDDDCDGEADEGCACAGAGVFVTGGADGMPCCEGLVAVTACQTDYGNGAMPSAGFFCTACGDGVCTAPESGCNCPEDCAVVQPGCLGEGEVGKAGNQLAASCCSGFVAVPVTYPVSAGKSVVCESGPVGEFVCTACGDGVCGAGENGCRCPADCELELCAVPETYAWVELSGLMNAITQWLGLHVATAGIVEMGPLVCTQLVCPPQFPCCNSCYAPLVLDGGMGVLLPLLAGGVDLPGCVGTNCDEVLECAPLPLDAHVVVYGQLLGPAPFGLAVSGFCLEPSGVDAFLGK